MPFSATQKRNVMAEFVEVTKATRESAQQYLRNNNYNLDAALNQPDRPPSKPPHSEGASEADSSHFPSSHRPSSSQTHRISLSHRHSAESLPGEGDPTMRSSKQRPARKSAANNGKSDLRVQKRSSSSDPRYFSANESALRRQGEADQSVNKALNDMFDSLGDGKSDELDVEGIFGYAQGLGIDMGSYEFFVLAEIVKVEAFGQITREGFLKGWRQVAEETRGKVPADMGSQKRFLRARIDLLQRDADYFKKVYRHAFFAGKEPGKREMAMNVALEFWAALFAPTMNKWRSASVDWLDAWERYLTEKFFAEGNGDDETRDGRKGRWTRTVSKDLWNQTHVFAAKTLQDESLSFWSEDQAWPAVVDEFVVWCRAKGVVPAGSEH